ncbi:hypothetical protein ABB37_07920 [Leptomonas pyrrhocoris]|uniref:Uncharacterized protein n=1 Tax=Leptomonas pyrrhocoris TaxID=157538 RepID=A0A0M9FUE3_LEPPY|nr:hypothetical protein ABB37_07920 [Leptomonas pyrrhocoris]XP_015654596.1 hypothetical protein ABB37_07920 [Leptomonas pyrrhocoris]KPA76156.1 hypothetical protein ABB37_07920 [Leptomonas pyrrhocoris]KPA76157.1 hypothetical protein ABB37_07920 [Leptomonas pyrrhocoris]|eukprot:XP_015654595.1 hypothetical protein ABB37_07920 [Leptomonas pyrrhocoris]
MAQKDTIIFLDLQEGAVKSIRGDGSDVKTLFAKDCVCPDGITLDLHEYKKSKDPADIVVWWSNMGAVKLVEDERDRGDWHAADGFPVRAALYGGDETVQRVEVKFPQRLICDGAAYKAASEGPLITTMKQIAL